ncbi:hypothetical protein [Corynebacterium hiratae]|uniref:Uncharacterized protein n=1 Tax=Corynebacterium hiratae TaxID=3139423 RepID=A0A553FWP5_9CORY|nr:hypothetical protein [Corynebacterium aurimucosum]TRX61643.1 hypothetical protein FNY97_07210 [Corynebacterium aurimucosum]
MDQPSIDPHFPNEPQRPAEPKESEPPPRRGLAGVFNEKLALWGSANLLGSWALGYLILLIADSIASDIEEAYLFGLPGIFIFMVLRFTTPFLAPLFAFLALASLSSDVPERKRNAIIALVLSIATVIPNVAYF